MVELRKERFSLSTVIIYFLLLLCVAVTVVPLLYVVFASFSTAAELRSKPFVIFPETWTLDAYRYLLGTSSIPRSLGVSALVTVVGTVINLLFTVTMAFGLAHRNLTGRKVLMAFVTFTLMFNPGIIPNYLAVKTFGMIDSLWSLMIPTAINTFNLVLMKNFFQEIPVELEESAMIDGANPVTILARIYIPLSMASIATFALFYAVTNWNQYLAPVLYLNDTKKWTIQIWLRQVVILSQQGFGDRDTALAVTPPSETIKLATIVLSTLPIVVVYPFVQRFFVTGVTMGSIKG